MGTFPGLNYWRMAPHLDVISGTATRCGTRGTTSRLASDIAFVHDINRCLKGGKPFMLMESAPSTTNWEPVRQAQAAGDARALLAAGGRARLRHGAVLPVAQEPRLVREVPRRGGGSRRARGHARLPRRGRPGPPCWSSSIPWSARPCGPTWRSSTTGRTTGRRSTRRGRAAADKGYLDDCKHHYRAFWKRGIPVDVIDMEQTSRPTSC